MHLCLSLLLFLRGAAVQMTTHMLDAKVACCVIGLQASQAMQQEAETQAAAANARAAALQVRPYPTCSIVSSV